MTYVFAEVKRNVSHGGFISFLNVCSEFCNACWLDWRSKSFRIVSEQLNSRISTAKWLNQHFSVPMSVRRRLRCKSRSVRSMQSVNAVEVCLFNALVYLPCTWIQNVVQCRLVRPPLDCSVEFDVSMWEWPSYGIWSLFRIVTGWYCPKRRLRSLDSIGMWSYRCSSTMSSRAYRGRADDRSNWFLTFEKSYSRSFLVGFGRNRVRSIGLDVGRPPPVDGQRWRRPDTDSAHRRVKEFGVRLRCIRSACMIAHGHFGHFV